MKAPVPTPHALMNNPRFKNTWRALSHRNYRLFFFGQGVSLVGTWMTRIATSWVVYRVSDPGTAEFFLGLVGFLGQLPTVLSPLAGVLIDRWDRHRVLIITQILSMIQSFAFAATVTIHQSRTAAIIEFILLSIIQGVINAFDMPVRQTFLNEMVTNKADLPNAIALNSSLVNGARLIGPSIAGLLIAWTGEFWCFFLDGASYIAVIAALMMMKMPAAEKTKFSERKFIQDLREGFDYSFKFQPIRTLLIQMAIVGFMGMSYTVLMPVFGTRLSTNGSAAMGFLMGAAGVGALTGALYMASRETVLGLGRLIRKASLLFSVGLMLFSFSKSLWISLPLMYMVGLGLMIQMAATNTMIQTLVRADMRARVLSLYILAFMGTGPFGALFAGCLAKWVGAPMTTFVSGFICLLGALWYWNQYPTMRKHIRPIYTEMGILPHE